MADPYNLSAGTQIGSAISGPFLAKRRISHPLGGSEIDVVGATSDLTTDEAAALAWDAKQHPEKYAELSRTYNNTPIEYTSPTGEKGVYTPKGYTPDSPTKTVKYRAPVSYADLKNNIVKEYLQKTDENYLNKAKLMEQDIEDRKDERAARAEARRQDAQLRALAIQQASMDVQRARAGQIRDDKLLAPYLQEPSWWQRGLGAVGINTGPTEEERLAARVGGLPGVMAVKERAKTLEENKKAQAIQLLQAGLSDPNLPPAQKALYRKQLVAMTGLPVPREILESQTSADVRGLSVDAPELATPINQAVDNAISALAKTTEFGAATDQATAAGMDLQKRINDYAITLSQRVGGDPAAIRAKIYSEIRRRYATIPKSNALARGFTTLFGAVDDPRTEYFNQLVGGQ